MRNCWDSFQNILCCSGKKAIFIRPVVSTKNLTYWLATNPRELQERLTHRESLWCAFYADSVIGSYFFQDDNEDSVTTTLERYVDVFRWSFEQNLNDREKFE